MEEEEAYQIYHVPWNPKLQYKEGDSGPAGESPPRWGSLGYPVLEIQRGGKRCGPPTETVYHREQSNKPEYQKKQGTVQSATRPRGCIIHRHRINCIIIPELFFDDFVTAILSGETKQGGRRVIRWKYRGYSTKAKRQCRLLLGDRLQLIVGCDANIHYT